MARRPDPGCRPPQALSALPRALSRVLQALLQATTPPAPPAQQAWPGHARHRPGQAPPAPAVARRPDPGCQPPQALPALDWALSRVLQAVPPMQAQSVSHQTTSAYGMVMISSAEKFSSAASRLAAVFMLSGLQLVFSHQKGVSGRDAVVILVRQALQVFDADLGQGGEQVQLALFVVAI